MECGQARPHRETDRRRCRIRLYRIKAPRKRGAPARCGRACGPSSRPARSELKGEMG